MPIATPSRKWSYSCHESPILTWRFTNRQGRMPYECWLLQASGNCCEQLRRTRHPVQKAQIALVLQAVTEAFERHRCTRQLKPEVLAAWKSWAAEHAKAFQRASSAVEGRNGSLSQMQHNHRGLPTRRYPVWTALHNFDCRATDGTTPASRFFRRSFPDLFESVLSQIDELPMPRQRRQALAATH